MVKESVRYHSQEMAAADKLSRCWIFFSFVVVIVGEAPKSGR
jgi:hypothetical protein